MRSLRRNARAFTLIELLVVISIIVLIISITLPNLGTAKEAARRTRCATQLRELANICVSIATDDRQRLPDLHNDTGKWGSPLYDNAPNPHTFHIKARDYLLKNYGLMRPSFYCPSNDRELWNRDDFWVHPSSRSVWGFVYYAAAPIGHASWSYMDAGPSPVFASTMTDQPRHNILWSDLYRRIEPYGWYRYDVARGANHFLNEEPTGSNNAHLDSHVEWVPYAKMKKRMTRGTWSFWF